MTNTEIKAIVANPYVSPEDLVKHYLSNPQYLEEWLRTKGKALAGVSIDCTQCVVSTYIAEKLTHDGVEFERIETCLTHVEISTEDEDISIRLPTWSQKFIEAIDEHLNTKGKPIYPYTSRCRIFSGNLANNILRVTLESGVE